MKPLTLFELINLRLGPQLLRQLLAKIESSPGGEEAFFKAILSQRAFPYSPEFVLAEMTKQLEQRRVLTLLDGSLPAPSSFAQRTERFDQMLAIWEISAAPATNENRSQNERAA